MDELFRRVQLLARLLRGVTSERTNYVDPAITAMELEWNASSLLAKFLKSADVAHRTIDRTYAASVIDNAMLSQLEERGLVRWILGRMQIAPGAQMAVARKAAGQYDGVNWVEPFPPEMTDALAKLVNDWNLREREPLVISTSTTESVRATHALAHPATPSIDTLVKREWFIRDDAVSLYGFQMHLSAGPQHNCGSSCFAKRAQTRPSTTGLQESARVVRSGLRRTCRPMHSRHSSTRCWSVCSEKATLGIAIVNGDWR